MSRKPRKSAPNPEDTTFSEPDAQSKVAQIHRRFEANHPGRTVIPGIGDNKLSAAILDVALPFLPEAEGVPIEEQDILKYSVVAWNTAVASVLTGDVENSLRRSLDVVLRELPRQETRSAVAEILAKMVVRKLELFAEDLRFVIEYELIDSDGTLALVVMSSEAGRGQVI